jgi:DNA-binding winged helix-turn-helix (wHTH) protein
MNGRNQQQQYSTEPLPQYRNALEKGSNGRSGRVHAEAVMQVFSFGPFRIIPYARLLERGGSAVPLGSRAFDLLCLLISHPGKIVSASELMAGAWPNATVEESNLRVHICLLRRALDDRQHGVRYVVNVPGRGYCFAACVSREAWPLKEARQYSTPSPILHALSVPYLEVQRGPDWLSPSRAAGEAPAWRISAASAKRGPH